MEASDEELAASAAREELKKTRAAADAEKARMAEEAILKRAAEKAAERALEAKEQAEIRAKAEADKLRRAEEAAAFLEQKRKLQAEEDEKKRLVEEERARKAEERRIRQKLIDDRSAFLAKQAARSVPDGLGQLIRNACKNADVEVIKAFADEWEGNAVMEELDKDKWGPVHWCCKKGCFTGAVYIMQKWMNPYESEDDQKRAWVRRLETVDDGGKTYLMLAAVAGATDLVKFILSKGANRNAQDEDGFSACMLAAYQGHVETVRALVEGLSALDLRTRGGKTALQCAVVGGDKDTIDYLKYAEDLRGLKSV
jgi:hypothetical protein